MVAGAIKLVAKALLNGNLSRCPDGPIETLTGQLQSARGLGGLENQELGQL